MAVLLCLVVASLVPLVGNPARALTPIEPRVASCGPYTPAVNQAYFNNPREGHPGRYQVQDLMECRYLQTKPGGYIRIATYSVSDETLVDVLLARHAAGVNVQVVIDGSRCTVNDAVTRLRAGLADTSGPRANGSFARCTHGSARSAGPVMHSKFTLINESGGSKHVTIVGSSNLTSEAIWDQWVDMFQYVDRPDVYGAYLKIFGQLAADKNLARPAYYWRAADNIARADFLPANNPGDKKQDPAWNRITSLPSRGTVIRIAMYSWAESGRGAWLKQALIQKKREGATIMVLTGPPVDDDVEAELRAAGISVTRAFDSTCRGSDHVDRDCNYIHLKFMTAKYQLGGTQYRTWTGSDNWVDLRSDEVIQRIGGKRVHDDYAAMFNRVRDTY